MTEPFGAGHRCGGGIVHEVSLVAPGQRPHEPMAQVSLLYEEPEAAARDEVIVQIGGVIRRPCGVVLGIR